MIGTTVNDVWEESRTSVLEQRSIKAKIMATVGPATQNKDSLSKLLNSGVELFRLNFSHGTYESHATVIQTLRKLGKETGKYCAIMIDLRGPHIRSGLFKKELGGKVHLKTGQKFSFHVNYIQGDVDRVTVSHWNLPKLLKPGDRILVDYGLISFTVVKIDDKEIITTVDNDGTLGENKVVNVKGIKDRAIELQFLSYDDTVDIDFAIRHGVDFLGANYVAKTADIDEIRRLPGVKESGIQIMVKLESKEGIEAADSIIRAADAIILPRSDIAVDAPVEQVAHIQKKLIYKSNMEGKPVFIANQILNSMSLNPRPTRAECTDVANAILEGADGIVLTNTTAIGKYPLETVEMIKRQYREVEKQVSHRAKYTEIRNYQLDRGTQSIAESVASSAVKTAWDLEATLIIVISNSGDLLRRVSKYRPHTPILCVTTVDMTARQSLICRGCIPIIVEKFDPKQDTLHVLTDALAKAKTMGLVKSEEMVIGVSGPLKDPDQCDSYQVIKCT